MEEKNEDGTPRYEELGKFNLDTYPFLSLHAFQFDGCSKTRLSVAVDIAERYARELKKLYGEAYPEPPKLI